MSAFQARQIGNLEGLKRLYSDSQHSLLIPLRTIRSRVPNFVRMCTVAPQAQGFSEEQQKRTSKALMSTGLLLRVSAVFGVFAASTACPAVGSLDRALSVRASHGDPLAVALDWDNGDAPFVNLPGASTGHTNAGCFAFKPSELSWSASPTPECRDSLTATILPEGETCQLIAVDLVRTTDALEVQLRFPCGKFFSKNTS